MADPRGASRLWLVTGANGFLGNVVVRDLVARGERVRALLRRSLDPESLRRVDCERAWFDTTDPAAMVDAFAHRDGEQLIVVHCAAAVSIANTVSPEVWRTNVVGTQNVIDACRAAGVARLVYVSSVHALPERPGTMTEIAEFDPSAVIGGYAQTKAEATRRVLAATDLDRVVVHPSGLIGPGDFGGSHLTRFVRDVASGAMKVVVPGGYDFADVRDVAAGTIAAAERGRNGQCYLLTGRYISMADAAAIVASAAGRSGRPRILPMWLAKIGALLVEKYAKARGVEPLFTSYSLHTVAAPSVFSHALADAELGYRVRPIEETFRDAVAWVRAHPVN